MTLRPLSMWMTVCWALSAVGCATIHPPRAWEKDVLARPQMQLEPDPLDSKLKQHIYTSKEAASGGYGVGGGGCGCN
jgi:hypothetical protein